MPTALRLAPPRTAKVQERLAVDPLHHEKEHATFLAEVEHLPDVEVLDAGHDARFVEEHPPKCRIGRVLGQDRLDGDQLVEPVLALLPSEPERSHAPLGDETQQIVPIQAASRNEPSRTRSPPRHHWPPRSFLRAMHHGLGGGLPFFGVGVAPSGIAWVAGGAATAGPVGGLTSSRVVVSCVSM
jgi:hypothetical protein